MTGLLVHAVAVPDRDQGHQGWLAAADQLAPVADKIGLVHSDTAS